MNIPKEKPVVVVVVADGWVLAPNKLLEPAVVPNAEPNRPPDVVQDGVANANAWDDGVPVPNENPPTPVPPPVAEVVLGVPNWNPPDIVVFPLQ